MAGPSPLRDALARLCARRYPTLFGTAKVYTTSWGNTRVRVLDIGGTYQSATYLDERWCEPPFPYLNLYGCIFQTPHPARTVCLLGGGGYAFPKQVVAHHPQARIDVVEIDPAITRIAYKEFFLGRLERTYHIAHNGRLRTYNTDALSYLRSCVRDHRHYDAILNDCYAAGVADASLATPKALAVVKGCLSHSGMYLVNIITALEGTQAQPLRKLMQALSTQFAHVLAIPCDRVETHQRDNVVVVASDRDPLLPQAIRLYDAL